jgi:uncharacterized protein YjcR
MTANRKSRGGQPGNKNAMSHGFYSRKFRTIEMSDLDASLKDNLTDEIALMRVAIRRFFDYLSDNEDIPLSEWALSSASTNLSTLLKTQKILTGQDTDVIGVLTSALSEVVKELGLSNGSK